MPGAVGRGALLPRHLHLHRQGGRDWRVCAGRRVACERTLARMTSAVSALAAMNAAQELVDVRGSHGEIIVVERLGLLGVERALLRAAVRPRARRRR